MYQCLLSLLLLPCLSPHPAPQAEDSYNDDYYGDYDAQAAATPTSDTGLLDLLRTGSSVAQGIFALLGEKVKLVNTLLADQSTPKEILLARLTAYIQISTGSA